MIGRRHLTGALALIGYVATAFALGSGGPILPLFDGQAPPAPYRWAAPPEDAQTTERPLPGRQEIDLNADVVFPLNAATGDGQAVVTGTDKSFEAVEGESAVLVTVQPLDPASLGSPPEDLAFDGNAYRVEASYRPSGRPAVPTAPATVVLRYATHATDILRLEGDRWVRVPRPTPLPAALQIFAETSQLGTFVAAGPRPPFNAAPWVAGGLAALAVAALIVVRVRTSRQRPAPKSRRR